MRIEFPGAFYDVMAGGNRREPIFLDDEDHRFSSRAFPRSASKPDGGFMPGFRCKIITIFGLAASGLREEDLSAAPGSEARKVTLAKLVRAGTIAPSRWIANRPAMGGAANAGHYVRIRNWNDLRKRLPPNFLSFVDEQLEGVLE